MVSSSLLLKPSHLSRVPKAAKILWSNPKSSQQCRFLMDAGKDQPRAVPTYDDEMAKAKEMIRRSKIPQKKKAAVEEALGNIVKVLLLNPLDVLKVLKTRPRAYEHILRWSDVRKGRDLFISGLGGFNIDKVYKTYAESEQVSCRRKTLCKLSHEGLKKTFEELCPQEDFISSFLAELRPWDRQEEVCQAWKTGKTADFLFEMIIRRKTTTWLAASESKDLSRFKRDLYPGVIQPHELQVQAYFGNKVGPLSKTANDALRSIFSNPSENKKKAKRHLIKHYHSWIAMDSFPSAIQALSKSKEDDLPDGWEDMDPLKLLNSIFLNKTCNSGDVHENAKHHFRKYQQEWVQKGNFRPCLAKLSAPDGIWPDGWEEMTPTTLLQSYRRANILNGEHDVHYAYLDNLNDSSPLRVLRSKSDIAAAALDLRNCAKSYAKYVERKERILVALDDKNMAGKVFALGEYFIHADYGWIGWGQIRLACNRHAPDTVERIFHNFTRNIKAWQNQFPNDARADCMRHHW